MYPTIPLAHVSNNPFQPQKPTIPFAPCIQQSLLPHVTNNPFKPMRDKREKNILPKSYKPKS